jgi:transposase, IS30 family
MSLRHPVPKPPGSPPLSAKRDLYIELMSRGLSNTAASRAVGINRRTGTRWRHGRIVVNRGGQSRTYKPIVTQQGKLSDRFLSEAERMIIADGVQAGHSIRSIARDLDRSPSTVSREIRRNRDPVSNRYTPFRAHQRAVQRRARPKPNKFAQNPELRTFVQTRLDQRWSPEQIAETLTLEYAGRRDMQVCHETIYQALYAPRIDALQRPAARVLRSGRSRRRPHRRLDQRSKRFIEPMTMIWQRPREVEGREVAGHWEGDLITGRKNQSAIGTLVERTTRFLMLLHLPEGHNAQQVSAALIQAFHILPPHLRRTITWDQGSEMGNHGDITLVTGTPIYFCDPGSPWQRPSNENTDGLLRQYFPKGTNLSIHAPDVLTAVAAELNGRPRKTLAWQTPHSQFERLRGPT